MLLLPGCDSSGMPSPGLAAAFAALAAGNRGAGAAGRGAKFSMSNLFQGGHAINFKRCTHMRGSQRLAFPLLAKKAVNKALANTSASAVFMIGFMIALPDLEAQPAPKPHQDLPAKPSGILDENHWTLVLQSYLPGKAQRG